jgi:hypothetical protein
VVATTNSNKPGGTASQDDTKPKGNNQMEKAKGQRMAETIANLQ